MGMHLLVFRFSAMGDVALVAPVLKNLLRHHPDLELTLVSRKTFAPFFQGLPRFHFYAADLNGRHKGFWGLLRLYRDLQQQGPYDAVVDLHDVLRTKVLTSLFRLRGHRAFIIDKGREEKRQLVRKNNKVFRKLKHSTERYFDAFRLTGLEGNLNEPEYFEPSPLARETLALFLQKQGLEKGPGPWVGIAPFARHIPKVWPLGHLKELIPLLHDRLNATIFLFGGGQEEIAQLQALQEEFPFVVNVSNRLLLPEGLALQQKLDLMLSMDSSNMHMAALSGVKVVSIWGPTHPYLGFWALYQPERYAVQVPQSELPNRPCSFFGNRVCEACQHNCMQRITPEQVFTKIREVLEK
jgi:ADP-heptose:LPS heptosyltransferase